MPINIQDLGVSDLRVGDAPVLKLYAGDTQIWTRPPEGPKIYEPNLTTGAGLTLIEDGGNAWTEFTPEGFYAATSVNGVQGAAVYEPTLKNWAAAENLYIRAKVTLPEKTFGVLSASYGMGVGINLRSNGSVAVETGTGVPPSNRWDPGFNIALVFNENKIRCSAEGLSWWTLVDQDYTFDTGVLLNGNGALGFWWWITISENTGSESLVEVYLSNSDVRPTTPILSAQVGIEGLNIRDYLGSRVSYTLGALGLFITEYGDQLKPMVFNSFRMELATAEPTYSSDIVTKLMSNSTAIWRFNEVGGSAARQDIRRAYPLNVSGTVNDGAPLASGSGRSLEILNAGAMIRPVSTLADLALGSYGIMCGSFRISSSGGQQWLVHKYEAPSSRNFGLFYSDTGGTLRWFVSPGAGAAFLVDYYVELSISLNTTYFFECQYIANTSITLRLNASTTATKAITYANAGAAVPFIVGGLTATTSRMNGRIDSLYYSNSPLITLADTAYLYNSGSFREL